MWVKLMKVGSLYGCHQMANRSYFVCNRQLPVCARCLGVLLGSLVAYLLFAFWTPSLLLCLFGSAVMLTDWLIQQLNIRESTNLRRLITGLLGGYALSTMFCMGIAYLLSRFVF